MKLSFTFHTITVGQSCCVCETIRNSAISSTDLTERHGRVEGVGLPNNFSEFLQPEMSHFRRILSQAVSNPLSSKNRAASPHGRFDGMPPENLEINYS